MLLKKTISCYKKKVFISYFRIPQIIYMIFMYNFRAFLILDLFFYMINELANKTSELIFKIGLLLI